MQPDLRGVGEPAPALDEQRVGRVELAELLVRPRPEQEQPGEGVADLAGPGRRVQGALPVGGPQAGLGQLDVDHLVGLTGGDGGLEGLDGLVPALAVERHQAAQGVEAHQVQVGVGLVHGGQGDGRPVPVTVGDHQGGQGDGVHVLALLGEGGSGEEQPQCEDPAHAYSSAKRRVWRTRIATARPW